MQRLSARERWAKSHFYDTNPFTSPLLKSDTDATVWISNLASTLDSLVPDRPFYNFSSSNVLNYIKYVEKQFLGLSNY